MFILYNIRRLKSTSTNHPAGINYNRVGAFFRLYFEEIKAKDCW